MKRLLPALLTCLIVSFLPVFRVYSQQKDSKENPQPAQQAEQDDRAEYDDWRGSSLGIRIDTRRDGFFVEKVLPQISDSPLKVGDKILKIGSVDFATSSLPELGKMLKTTQPETEIAASIIRDGEEMELSLKTYRKQLVDIATIAELIQGNKIIKDHLAELDRTEQLETMSERMIAAVKNANSPREAYEGINQVIDDIGISHTAFVPRETYLQLTSNTSGEIGLALRRFEIDGESGYYVVDIKPGSAAYQKEILIGDKIEAINGVEIERSRRLILAGEEQRYEMFGVSADRDEPVTFTIKHSPDSPELDTVITATQTVSLQDSIVSSAKIIETNDREFGYIRLWNLMSVRANIELKKQLADKFANSDALILDLRGRGGTLSAVIAVDKTIRELDIPVVAITDELTRSAKELLSFRLKKHGNVIVIGERTSGAVTAARFTALPSGNAMMYPAQSSKALSRHTEGVILEGNGVEPDKSFNFYEPFCNGRDGLLQSAIERGVIETEFDLP